MAWINVNDKLPEDGQEVYYFSPILGLWRGKYTYSPFTHSVWYDENNQPHEEPVSEGLRNAVSPHVFSCGSGCCDTDEVTHWQPYDEKRAAEGWCPLPPNHGISDERMAEYRAWRDPRRQAELAEEFVALEKTPPKVLPDISWMEADELWVDPPSGWRYGFPKVWNKKTHPDMKAWLVENGYPEKAAQSGELICRFMSIPEETVT